MMDIENRIPLCEYPRPQMARDSYMCLNGRWTLKFISDGKDAREIHRVGSILA